MYLLYKDNYILKCFKKLFLSIITRNSKDYDGDIKKKRNYLERNTPVFWVKEWRKFKISMTKAGKNKRLPRSVRLRLVNKDFVLAEQVIIKSKDNR